MSRRQDFGWKAGDRAWLVATTPGASAAVHLGGRVTLTTDPHLSYARVRHFDTGEEHRVHVDDLRKTPPGPPAPPKPKPRPALDPALAVEIPLFDA